MDPVSDRMKTLDAYKVFKVQRNFTLDEIKKKYRNFALQLHPDKNKTPAAAQLFQAISFCYQTLLEDHCMRLSDKQGHELKQESQDFHRHQAETANIRRENGAAPSFSADPVQMGGEYSFNVERFNRVFADNRVPDVHDRGYEDWLRNAPEGDKAAEKLHKKLAVALYQPLYVHTTDPNNSYELGESKIKDYSKATIVGASKSGLNYTDLRVAHSTIKLADNLDPTAYRPDFENVGALKAERARVRYDMSQADIAREQKQLRREAKHEETRLKMLRKRDELATIQHDRCTNLLMGGGR